MQKPTITQIDDVAGYDGEHQIPGIAFRALRQALDVTSFGMNVFEFAPNCDGHPTHDHAHDGQEEVYIVLEGAITLYIGDAQYPLAAGTCCRVPAEANRQLRTGSEGARVLALGATPGKAFTPTM